jgi:hypothetical protein
VKPAKENQLQLSTESGFCKGRVFLNAFNTILRTASGRHRVGRIACVGSDFKEFLAGLASLGQTSTSETV